jgi:predicted SprT family Zn-dependent metalloprotease
MELEAAHKLAIELMRLHRVPTAWTFAFDRSKVRFGRCHYGLKQISLSRYLVELNDEAEVRDTILHEIAHALAPKRAGHGPAWQAVARSIGCNAQRCYGEEVTRPRPRFQGTCPKCRQTIFRHRRSVLACGRCSRSFDPRFLFVWVESPSPSRRGPG